jgi:predicted nucleotide-binding protein (sugar kinase/HSP70/actin superfamily)
MRKCRRIKILSDDFLTGDIYLRLDDFGSDAIIRRLNARGIRVIVEPLWVLAEYLVEERSAELFSLPQGTFMNAMAKVLLPKSRKHFYEMAQNKTWLPTFDVPEMLKKAKPIIDRHPRGEAR